MEKNNNYPLIAIIDELQKRGLEIQQLEVGQVKVSFYPKHGPVIKSNNKEPTKDEALAVLEKEMFYSGG